MSMARKAVLKVIIVTAWWINWNFRKRCVYDTNKLIKNRMFNDIVLISFS